MDKMQIALRETMSQRLREVRPAKESVNSYLQWRMDCKRVASVLLEKCAISRGDFLDLCGVPADEQ